VKRLRTLRLRYWIMPVILAALSARAFLPAGFMASSGDGTEVRIIMCSQEQGRSETLEIPGDPAGHERGLQCKYCGAPILGTPFASFDMAVPAPAPLLAVTTDTRSIYSPLPRSQAARAPPRA
jgi:hypothetical protein